MLASVGLLRQMFIIINVTASDTATIKNVLTINFWRFLGMPDLPASKSSLELENIINAVASYIAI
ncbi:MAG: hypothetical protein Faunusvirus1_58 [Faunusvirus sp.]|uniref:Uncharacterized protein n=1 Tax=Faunusvirus sp. TaxID=2487766 RepID=A0A3G4ZVV9_9VIRU|nr:MAG: hypothetical protein Faunusvirus1_58 [Faunusvirus sp.]